MDFLHQLFDVKGGGLQQLIISFGYLFLFGVVFAETGLLIGFFLPGDSLLFIAGLVAADPKNGLSIAILLLLLSVAAIAGDSVGFFIGRKAGPALFKREDSKLFKRKHLDAAHAFYEKHGPKTIILARFVPIVRTFAPTVAGAAGMDYRQFVVFNIIGGITWIFSMTLLGYFLGGVEVVKNNLEKAVIGIVLLSIVPVVLHALKERKHNAKK
ncbi:DedA family protein [bacterium]|nr:MAG: DedA family protein [bacterium]